MSGGSDILDVGGIGDFGRLGFDAVDIGMEIVANGVECDFWRAVPCPCVRVETRLPAADCGVCRGTGFAYPEELRSELTVLGSGRGKRWSPDPSGESSQGDERVTFPPGITVGRGDQLRPKGERHVVLETLFRGLQEVRPHELPRPPHVAPRAPRPRREALLYPDPACVEMVAWIADGKLRTLTGSRVSLIREEGRGARIRFPAEGGPAPGSAYTVRYLAPAAYVVHLEGPAFRQHAETVLPESVSLKRLDRLMERQR